MEREPLGKIEEKKKGMFVREMIVMPMVGTIVMTQQLSWGCGAIACLLLFLVGPEYSRYILPLIANAFHMH